MTPSILSHFLLYIPHCTQINHYFLLKAASVFTPVAFSYRLLKSYPTHKIAAPRVATDSTAIVNSSRLSHFSILQHRRTFKALFEHLETHMENPKMPDISYTTAATSGGRFEKRIDDHLNEQADLKAGECSFCMHTHCKVPCLKLTQPRSYHIPLHFARCRSYRSGWSSPASQRNGLHHLARHCHG